MTLAVVGMGMVSPAGRTPEENAFVLRARAAPPPRSPFKLADGLSIDVRFCPFLGARHPVGERLARMAGAALGSALAPLGDAHDAHDARVWVCTAHDRAGLGPAERAHVEAAARALTGARHLEGVRDAAGTFAALAQAQALLQAGHATMAVLVACDSYVCVEALAWDAEHPRGPWADVRWPRGEGAAALLMMSEREARQRGLPTLGRITGAATALGNARDDTDEPADGCAMTDVLRRLPNGGRARLALGSAMLDSLRRRDWYSAVARSPARFHVECEHAGIEDDIGDVGAAAGAMNVVLALATQLHDTGPVPDVGAAGTLAWAVSGDGTRGAARIEVAP